MKKLALTILACFPAVCFFAQGTVNFVNLNAGSGVNAPVYQEDGTTKLVLPYVAQLFYSATASGTLTALGTPVAFLTGGGAGYFNGGTFALPGVARGATAWLMVAAWDSTLGGTTTGATEAQAFAYALTGHHNIWGASGFNLDTLSFTPFPITTGNPTASPPTTPANLVGLTEFRLVWIPEPSPFALMALGVTVLGAVRRGR